MINFISKPPFIMRHLQRVSSIIRGEQIAAYMGNARLNPPSIDEGDVNVFVKPHIKKDEEYNFPKNSWVDIQDGWDLTHVLRRYPEVGVITYSDLEDELIAQELPNKRALIPHHHLNFERVRRNREKIKVVGMTGSGGALGHIPDAIKEGILKRDLKLEYCSTFYPRMAVSKFHESIDLQLHWRPYRRRLSAPFKIINASSFGIPTIALDEPSFKEVEGTYIPVESIDGWFEKLDLLLESPDLYKYMAEKGIEISEKYHIDNIAKLYERLT